jgi:P4 family phage/plasmid primase-like protien
MQTVSTKFLAQLFGKHVSKDAKIQVYANKKGQRFKYAKRQMLDSVEAAERFVKTYQEGHDIYFNCCLVDPAKCVKSRGGNSDMAIMTCLYADLDAKEGVHSREKPSFDELGELLASGVVPQPNLTVRSGGGLHVYWLLETPVTDMAAGQQMLAGINQKINEWHKAKGYAYEQLKDTARVLRVPGTFNQKTDPPKQVILLSGGADNPYENSDITFTVEKEVKQQSEFDELPVIADPEAARKAIAKRAPQWGSDGSGYVLHCCRQCVRYGLSEQEAVALVQETLQSLEGFPKKYKDSEIAKRYRDAGKQSELGEAVGVLPENTEMAFAKMVGTRLKDRVYWVPAWKAWVAWDGLRFKPSATSLVVLETIESVSRELEADAPKGEGKDADKARAAHAAFARGLRSAKGVRSITDLSKYYMATETDIFDKQTDLFHCQNAVLSLGEKIQVQPHNPAYLNTIVSPTVYNPDAKCPRWEKAIEEIFVDELGLPDLPLARYVQKLFGYFLTGRTNDQSIYLFYGGGSNGKSVVNNTLLSILGDYSAPVSQDILVERAAKDEIAHLYNKRVVIAEETDDGCALKENQVKMLTGTQRMTARRLYENLFSFDSTHKIILATNNKPDINGTDKGIWRRIKIIPFYAEFQVGADKTLDQDLMNERSGILNWALKGYEMLTAEGLGDLPQSMRQQLDEYHEDMDTIGQWFECCCQENVEKSTDRTLLYRNYVHWCEQGRLRPKSHKKFYGHLERAGFKKKKIRGARHLHGIYLISDFEE